MFIYCQLRFSQISLGWVQFIYTNQFQHVWVSSARLELAQYSSRSLHNMSMVDLDCDCSLTVAQYSSTTVRM